METQQTQLDQSVVNLAKAIKMTETGGTPKQGASGESGRYQFMPGTWNTLAGKYLGNSNAPQDNVNENKVAYYHILDLKNQGYKPAQIASIWNSGKPNWQGNVGINKQGVQYNTPDYVKKVYQNYQSLSGGPIQQTIQQPQQQVVPPQQPKDTFLEGHPILRTLSDITGLTGLAKGISQSIFLQTQTGKQLMSDLQAGKITPDEFDNIVGGGLAKPKEVIGSAIQTGATLGLADIPFQAGKTVAARIGKAALGGAAIGGVSGLGQGIEQGNSISDVLKSTAIGGAVGGTLGGAFGGLTEALSYATKKLPVQIVRTNIKDLPSQMKKTIRFGTEDTAQGVVDRGLVGTDRQLLNKSISQIKSNSSELEKYLAQPQFEKVKITKKDILPYFKGLLDEKGIVIGGKEELAAIDKVVKDIPSKLNLVQATERKSALYSALGDKSFLLDPALSAKREAQKTLAFALKDLIEKKTGSGVVRALNKETGFFLDLQDDLIRRMAQQEGKGGILRLGMRDVLGGGLGGAVAGAPGAAVGIGAERALQSTLAKTAGAKVLRTAGKLGSKTAGALTKTIPLVRR